MERDKMRLWSIQEASKLDEINSTGKLICTENKYSLEWDNEYKWMAGQMNEKIGLPKNENQYPIWAWYQYQDSKHKKPDLRKSGHLPSGTNGIRIEFEKSIENVTSTMLYGESRPDRTSFLPSRSPSMI